jgi:hypothetical protein
MLESLVEEAVRVVVKRISFAFVQGYDVIFHYNGLRKIIESADDAPVVAHLVLKHMRDHNAKRYRFEIYYMSERATSKEYRLYVRKNPKTTSEMREAGVSPKRYKRVRNR